jgi:hypothetical protein
VRIIDDDDTHSIYTLLIKKYSKYNNNNDDDDESQADLFFFLYKIYNYLPYAFTLRFSSRFIFLNKRAGALFGGPKTCSVVASRFQKGVCPPTFYIPLLIDSRTR